jgi:hypothetical protein
VVCQNTLKGHAGFLGMKSLGNTELKILALAFGYNMQQTFYLFILFAFLTCFGVF